MPLPLAASVLALVMPALPPPAPAVTFSATLTALPEGDALGAIDVEVTVADGWSVPDAGIPKLFLQIDPPAGVVLAGKMLETHRELARNEFVREPFERLVDPGTTTVRFTLGDVPVAEDAVIALNLVGYVRNGAEGPCRFVRRRMHLPLAAGAIATPGPARVSAWGAGNGGLQIGDRADAFALPRADGSTVALADYLDEKNVLLTTYRAYW